LSRRGSSATFDPYYAIAAGIEAIFGNGHDVVAAVSAVAAEKPKRRHKELGSAGAAAFAKII
jgi:hypothetical protein